MEVQRQSQLVPFVAEQRSLKNSIRARFPTAAKEQRRLQRWHGPAALATTEHQQTQRSVKGKASGYCSERAFISQ